MDNFRHSHEPTDAQLAAGNYPKRSLRFQGLRISIENPAGSVRRGVDPGGKAWETRMVFDYGYIRGSEGMDGDHVDVFVGPNQDAAFAYVIDQRRAPDFDDVDEQKCMLGFDSLGEACHAYLQHYDDSRFLGAVKVMPMADFKAAVRLTVDGEPFIKSDVLFFKALGAGERWITVHPNGNDAKGVPVLIVEHPDGTASVIGGAGGKLNHLKLRGIKPKGEYKQALAEKHAARQEARKQQIEADKAAGVHDEKVAARGKIKEEVKKGREEFVAAVAELAGWSPEEVEFNEAAHAGLSPEAVEKARAQHHKDLFKRAKETVELNRQRLVEDSEARAQAGLGEVPLTAPSADDLSAADLSPMPEANGAKLGFDADYAGRANLTTDEAKAEAATVMPDVETVKPDASPEAAQAKAEKAAASEAIAKELDEFKLNNPDVKPPSPKVLTDATKAAALLKAQKRLRLLEQKAKDANRELDSATAVESKAHVIEVSDAEIDEATRKQLEDDVRTSSARGFLDALNSAGGESKVAGHVGTGAFNSLNAASLAIAGDGLIDRSVVDVLGVSGAASVLARRIALDMGGDADKVRQAVENFHVENVAKLEQEAVAKAQEYHDAAAAIELPEAETGFDLATAQEANQRRRDAISEAQRVLGQAHGEMQASAALVAALQGKAPERLEVSLGGVKPEAAVQQLRAIGVQPGEYQLESVGGNLVATINAAGMDRLASPIDKAGMAQIRRNLDIIEGKHDEDGWLPGGFARRPDLAMEVKPGVAERLAQPFAPGHDLQQSLRDYIGGRMADGDAPVDILADVQSADFFGKAGDIDGYRKALDAVAPLKGEDGKMRPVDSLRESWEKMADEFVSAKYGADRSPIHKQDFEVDQRSVDALHRALAATPEGVAAFKQVGELSPQERAGLRKWWQANIAKEDPETAAKRQALEEHDANEPERESEDMFGEKSVNPDWHGWKSKRDEMAAGIKAGSLDWPRYVEMLGSPAKAIESVQDLVRSRVAEKFAEVHNTLNPGSPLKLGKTTIRNNLDHLDAVDPKARADRVAKERELIDSLRERQGGKYAAGGIKDKLAEQKEKAAAFEQSQMGFFSTEDLADSAPAGATVASLGADERHTLGHVAERRLAGMMSVVGQNFKPGQPTKLWQPSMSGGKNAARQRLLKLLEANKRVMAAFGTGSGKSALQLGGFTHLHEAGKVKKGIIIAPSIVVGQFGGEALRYLEPGKYKWHAQPGASREERLAAYRDPETHFSVVTHQSFRDDMIHLGAKHAGIPEAEMADRLQKMTPDQRAAWSKSVMDTEGFKFDYMSTDESQYTLNREGKENSRLANVVDAFADHADYYMPSSGDPVKNDASEIFDVLSKMDRKRYSDRAAFMRKYGGDTLSAKAALKREMARYFYPSKIDPDVKADRRVINVPLNDYQKQALASLDKHVSDAKLAKMEGRVAVDAIKQLAPERFAGVPEEKHEAIAAALQKSVGLLRNAATQRILNVDPKGAKYDDVSKAAAERKGKPGVVFARNLETVENLRQRLEAEGHRVVALTGADSSQDKDKKRLFFNPEHGEARADILIASDAAATGMNLQRGMWLGQMNTPDTAMVHGQRNGRIFRTGQLNDVELLDFVHDHKSERQSRARLEKKYGLREMMTSPLEGLDDTGLAWHLRQAMAQQQGLL